MTGDQRGPAPSWLMRCCASGSARNETHLAVSGCRAHLQDEVLEQGTGCQLADELLLCQAHQIALLQCTASDSGPRLQSTPAEPGPETSHQLANLSDRLLHAVTSSALHLDIRQENTPAGQGAQAGRRAPAG